MRKRTDSARLEAPRKDDWARRTPSAGVTTPDPEFAPHPDASISRLSLAEDDVHLWSLSLVVEDALARELERCLSGDERRQIARLRFARQRRARVLSRGLLRCVLAPYVGLPAERIQFGDGPYGKPELSAEVAGARAGVESKIGFNLSHSADMMLIAVAPTDRIGVDVERIRSIDQADRIALRYFSARERTSIAHASAGRATEVFLRAWTRKEAVAKAMGEGIVRSLSRLEVTAGPDEPAELLAIDGDASRAAGWSLFHLVPADGYTGALAIAGRSWRVSAWVADARQFLPEASEAT